EAAGGAGGQRRRAECLCELRHSGCGDGAVVGVACGRRGHAIARAPGREFYTVMCGRYASFIAADRLHRLFRTVNPTPNLQPTWNMAPTRDAPVVRLHPETRQRHLDLLRWGLVPHWARDPKAV